MSGLKNGNSVIHLGIWHTFLDLHVIFLLDQMILWLSHISVLQCQSFAQSPLAGERIVLRFLQDIFCNPFVLMWKVICFAYGHSRTICSLVWIQIFGSKSNVLTTWQHCYMRSHAKKMLTIAWHFLPSTLFQVIPNCSVAELLTLNSEKYWGPFWILTWCWNAKELKNPAIQNSIAFSCFRASYLLKTSYHTCRIFSVVIAEKFYQGILYCYFAVKTR